MKKSKRFLAFAMSAILTTTMFSSIAFANTEGGTIGGDSTLTQAVINVVVPTSLSFALDPLQLSYSDDALDGGETNQIADHAFTVVNKSNAPILAAFGLYVDINETEDEEVELVAAYDDAATKIDPVDPTKNTAEDKQMYFATRVATGLAAAPAPQTIDLTTDVATVRGAYDDADASTPDTYADIADTSSLSETTPDMSMAFLLGKATYTADAPTTLAASDAGVAIFQFYAQMNSYAPWKAGDIKVTGVYTLSALSAATYKEHTDANDITEATLGGTLVKADEAGAVVDFTDEDGPFGTKPAAVSATVGFTDVGKVSDIVSKNYTFKQGSGNTDITVGFNFGGKTVEKVYIVADWVATTDYTVGANSILLKATKLNSLSAGNKDLVVKLVGDTKLYTIKLVQQ